MERRVITPERRDYIEGQVWKDFQELLGEDKGREIEFIETMGLSGEAIDNFVERTPEELIELVGGESETAAVVLSRIKALGYWVAYKEIARMGEFRVKGEGGEQFREIQKRIDEAAAVWLTHVVSTEMETEETQEWASKQLRLLDNDLSKRSEKGFTNLQVLRGSKCNVQCVFCFTQRAELQDQDTKKHLAEVAKVNYDKGDLALEMLYARMAYSLDEILFTSYGDPLFNERIEGQGREVNPFGSLNEEIALAKKLGFPQVTILTNGTGFYETRTEKLDEIERGQLGVGEGEVRELDSEERDRLGRLRIDRLVESGLTNLTISLHTMNEETWRRLVVPRNGVSYDQMVKWVRYAGQKEGLVARVNVAYGTEVEEAEELIPWAKSLGIQELTLVEMIKANQYAIEHYKVPPDDDRMGRLGYGRVGGFGWGLVIYRRNDDDPSVAVCHFGQQDPGFADQAKNLELILSGQRREKGTMLIAGGLWGAEQPLEWWRI